ncbi:H-2 class II histocompatibility antigen, E-S beta chain-like [Hippoglossus stenolepis]|uniref:H-2 class II histocompatibility antigen, E-S beta chain-like n=1 Tax=Hippoglossus stenolepis TaxID=195615 RepID=UPI00159C8097|nr:H-2 class II histocompatibility antigen, E-S beta chain-like [Hippoglossus stenolepis]
MNVRSFSSLLCVFLLFPIADAFFVHGFIRCQLISKHEVVYLEQVYFNKRLIVQYNSSLGNYTSYVEYMKEVVHYLNDPSFLKKKEKDIEKCRSHLPKMEVLSTPVKPYVRLSSAKAESGRHQRVLVCNVYNFYPKQIRVTWLRDGKNATSDVTSTDKLANGNWLYHIHSHLEYTPRLREKITCMVEHVSFKDPQLYDWDPMSESERKKFAVGTAGLLLGLVVLLAGGIYYKRNTTGRELVPTG